MIRWLTRDSIAGRQIEDITIFGNLNYRRLATYDSMQRLLLPSQRERGLIPWLYHHWFSTITHYGNGTRELIVNRTRNIVPKMMFFFSLCSHYYLSFFIIGKNTFMSTTLFFLFIFILQFLSFF